MRDWREADPGGGVMVLRGLLAGFAAIVLSGLLAGPADAYTTTLRSGYTSVTGTYRPVNFDFSVTNEPGYVSTFEYNDNPFFVPFTQRRYSVFLDVSLTLFLEGTTWTGVGYEDNPTGSDGGIWRLSLDNLIGILDNSTATMAVGWFDNAFVGTLDLLKAGDYSGLTEADTPIKGDRFQVWTRSACPPQSGFFFITCHILDVSNFVFASPDFQATLSPGALLHVGPYTLKDGQYVFDSARNNLSCTETSRSGCGGIGLDREGRAFASSSIAAPAAVPEPGTLALLALGLAGLTLRRRAA